MIQGTHTQLAPFYDLVCTAVYPNLSQKLAFKIGGENRPHWLMWRHWDRFAEEIAVKPKFVSKVINDMIQGIELVLPDVATELGSIVSNPDEMQMIGQVSAHINTSVTLMKSRLKSKN
jgi:serine/threonine-protein kinase HipA